MPYKAECDASCVYECILLFINVLCNGVGVIFTRTKICFDGMESKPWGDGFKHIMEAMEVVLL